MELPRLQDPQVSCSLCQQRSCLLRVTPRLSPPVQVPRLMPGLAELAGLAGLLEGFRHARRPGGRGCHSTAGNGSEPAVRI